MKHEESWLRGYLIAGVEDPRLNLQSILSRHFLVRALFGARFDGLMTEEIRFAGVMDWLLGVINPASEPEGSEAVLHALKRGADNAEGLPVPSFVLQAYAAFSSPSNALAIPNYIESFLLGGADLRGPQAGSRRISLETFQTLWADVLGDLVRGSLLGIPRLSVLEPACGSANDYRFLKIYGLAQFLDYFGFDLCSKNIENAKVLCPDARFEIGNVFEIPTSDASFDLCMIHDLFEHLSLEGLHAAVNEVCRITRQGLCIGFFQMDEIAEHVVRPVDEYHWNLLSARRMKELFRNHGFTVQVLHIGTFLNEQIGCPQVHNPDAYTFFLDRKN
jgi:SAM-dependent methyltransferase